MFRKFDLRSLRARSDLEFYSNFNKSCWEDDWPLYVKTKKEAESLREKEMNRFTPRAIYPFMCGGAVLAIIFVVLGFIFKAPWLGICGTIFSAGIFALLHYFVFTLVSKKRMDCNFLIGMLEDKWNTGSDENVMQKLYEEYSNTFKIPPRPKRLFDEEEPVQTNDKKEDSNGTNVVDKKDFFEYDILYTDEELEEGDDYDQMASEDESIAAPESEPELEDEPESEIEPESEEESGTELEEEFGAELDGTLEKEVQEEEPIDGDDGGEIPQNTFDDVTPVEKIVEVDTEVETDETPDVETKEVKTSNTLTKEAGDDKPEFNSVEDVLAYYSKLFDIK